MSNADDFVTSPAASSSESYWMQAWRKLVADHKASRLSAALSYRTIFSIVPVAVLCIVIVRGVVHQDDAKDWMRRVVYTSSTWTTLFSDYTEPGSSGRVVAKGVDDLMDIAWGLNLTDVGVVGGLVLIYAALALFMELEFAFNDILGIKRRRPWMRRVTNYWAFVTLGPLLLFGALYGASQSMAWLETHFAVHYVADFLAAWLLLLFLYKVMPSDSVRTVAALIGSFLAAVLWVMSKWAFELYVTTAMPYAQLYGSLALLPLFMFWLYMNWWIVLFGLEVTAFRHSRIEQAA